MKNRREQLQKFKEMKKEIVATFDSTDGFTAVGFAIGDIVEANREFLTDDVIAELMISAFKAGEIAGKEALKRRIALLS